MKKTFIILGLILLICGSCTNVANKHPTKEEWLEVYLTHKIKQQIDSWQQRVAVIVAISPKDQEIVVTLTSSNGQEEIAQSAKNAYIHDVEVFAKTILETYDWAKNYKLTIQYI
jgi:translation initiation factor 2B subunit (eIF-2B alpha/beta/delta family)